MHKSNKHKSANRSSVHTNLTALKTLRKYYIPIIAIITQYFLKINEKLAIETNLFVRMKSKTVPILYLSDFLAPSIFFKL